MTALDDLARSWLRGQRRRNLILLLVPLVTLAVFFAAVAKNWRLPGTIALVAFIFLGVPCLWVGVSGLRWTRRIRRALQRSRWQETSVRHAVLRDGSSATDLVEFGGEVRSLGARPESFRRELADLPVVEVAGTADGGAPVVVRAPGGRVLNEAKLPKNDRARQAWHAAF